MQKKTITIILVMVMLGGCSALKTMEFNNKYGSPQESVPRLIEAHAPGEVSC